MKNFFMILTILLGGTAFNVLAQNQTTQYTHLHMPSYGMSERLDVSAAPRAKYHTSHSRKTVAVNKHFAAMHHHTTNAHVTGSKIKYRRSKVTMTGRKDKLTIIRYKQGEVRQGYVTGIYDTASKKATLQGFKLIVPPQFQKPTWVQVNYDKGMHRTIAIVPKGMHVREGDVVKIAFGTRHPPIPNRVVKVIHARKMATTYR